MRLFVAIPLAGPPQAALAQALREWRRQFPAARWDEPAALHLTLQFIGAWPDARESELIAALDPLRLPALTLHLAGIGAFPSPRHPRLVWAGVRQDAELDSWVEAIAARLAPLGIVREARPFTPHVSLARFRQPLPLPFDPDRPDWGDFPADGFGLYQTLSGTPPAERYQLRCRFSTAAANQAP